MAIHNSYVFVAMPACYLLGFLTKFSRQRFNSGGCDAARCGPVGADAGAAVPDVPGAAGAAATVVSKRRRALAAARPLPSQLVLHATTLIPRGNMFRHILSTMLLIRCIDSLRRL
jgi:hypothetical protein